jgi:cytochrome c556
MSRPQIQLPKLKSPPSNLHYSRQLNIQPQTVVMIQRAINGQLMTQQQDEKTLLERKQKLMKELLDVESKLAAIAKEKFQKAKEVVANYEKIQEHRQKENEEFLRKMSAFGEPPAKIARIATRSSK